MSDALEVASAERVAMQLPIAGLGSRAMAWLVDASLIGAVLLVCYFLTTIAVPDPVNAVLALGPLTRALGLLGSFLVLWGYWTFFELRWQGQTVGKRLLHIRVVKLDGAPVTPMASAARNLLRIVDFAPVCYPVGLVTMLIDKQHRRLGDLVAGTVLVRDEAVDLSHYEAVKNLNVGVGELELATAWLQRFEVLEPNARLRLGQRLAARLQLPESDDVQVLRSSIQQRLATGG